ncbi:MAG: DUF1566 domain-containing protein, partial [Candidatus Atribacteria bacterium]|nr:DUF1566 domain-containing protein [Candidatus Atribacteria bacterium]
ILLIIFAFLFAINAKKNEKRARGFKFALSSSGITAFIAVILIIVATFTTAPETTAVETATVEITSAAENTAAETTAKSSIEKGEYNIGEPGPAGGLIFYVNPYYATDGWRYLEAAPSDQSTGIQWCDGSAVTTGATETSLGTGKANTQTIVNIQGKGNYAARLCNVQTVGGYSDWFLPSRDELNEMYVNLYLKGLGGFAPDFYWSSSEDSAGTAWWQWFSNGGQVSDPKGDDFMRVRAARAF